MVVVWFGLIWFGLFRLGNRDGRGGEEGRRACRGARCTHAFLVLVLFCLFVVFFGVVVKQLNLFCALLSGPSVLRLSVVLLLPIFLLLWLSFYAARAYPF